MKLLLGTTIAVYSLSSVSAQGDAVDPCTDLTNPENLAGCVGNILTDLQKFQNGRFSNRFKNKMSDMIGEEVMERTSAMMDEVDAKIAEAGGNGPDMDVNGNVYISYGGSASSPSDSESETESEEPAYDAAAHLADQAAGLRDYWDFDDMPTDTIKEIMLQRFFEYVGCAGQISSIVNHEMLTKYQFGFLNDENTLQHFPGFGEQHDALMAHWAEITEPLGAAWQMATHDDFMAAYGDAWANNWININGNVGPKSLYKDEYYPAGLDFEPYLVHSTYVYCNALPNMIRPNKFEHDPWHPSALGSGMDDYDLLDEIAHARFFEFEKCQGQVWQLFLAEMGELFSFSDFDAMKSTAIREHWSEILADKTELYGNWFADSDWIDFFEEHGRAWANSWVPGYNSDPLLERIIKGEYLTPMAFGHPYYFWSTFKYCQVLPNVLRVSNLKHGIEYNEGDYIMGQESIHPMDEPMDFFTSLE